MRHAPGYGPYENMSSRIAYTHGTTYGLISCNEGTGTTTLGATTTYCIQQEPQTTVVSRIWSVEDQHGEDAEETGAAVLSVNSSNMATITFNQRGVFEIYYRTYRSDGILVSDYNVQAIVE